MHLHSTFCTPHFTCTLGILVLTKKKQCAHFLAHRASEKLKTAVGRLPRTEGVHHFFKAFHGSFSGPRVEPGDISTTHGTSPVGSGGVGNLTGRVEGRVRISWVGPGHPLWPDLTRKKKGSI